MENGKKKTILSKQGGDNKGFKDRWLVIHSRLIELGWSEKEINKTTLRCILEYMAKINDDNVDKTIDRQKQEAKQRLIKDGSKRHNRNRA